MACEIFNRNKNNTNNIPAELQATETKQIGSSANHKAGRYPCSVCGKRFQKPSLLKRHNSVHTTAKEFQCTECHKCFTQKSALQRHNSQQHKEAVRHQCPMCACSFAQRSNMLTHLQRIHPTRTPDAPHGASNAYACNQCSCVYTKQNVLTRHKRVMHPTSATPTTLDAEPFQGDATALAQQVLEQLKSLQSGMQYLTATMNEAEVALQSETLADQQPAEEITVVEEAVSSMVQLQDRLNAQRAEQLINVQRVQRADGVSYYVCEYCAKEFRKSYDFIRHRRVHTCERPYQCVYCQRAFSTSTQLHAHARIHQLDDRHGILARQHSCPICAQNYSSMRKLDAHMCTHQQTHTLRYLCNQCTSSFATKTAFAAHKHTAPDENSAALGRLMHSGFVVVSVVASAPTHSNNSTSMYQEKWLPIETLSASAFSHKPVVVTHAHSTCSALPEMANFAAKHKCHICCKGFQKPNDLRRHLRIHSGEKSHECAHCHKRFRLRGTLQQHQLTHQSTRRKYACQVCGKIYAAPNVLKIHLRLHTGTRPFQCSICLRDFRTSGHRIAHMRAAHQQKVET